MHGFCTISSLLMHNIYERQILARRPVEGAEILGVFRAKHRHPHNGDWRKRAHAHPHTPAVSRDRSLKFPQAHTHARTQPNIERPPALAPGKERFRRVWTPTRPRGKKHVTRSGPCHGSAFEGNRLTKPRSSMPCTRAHAPLHSHTSAQFSARARASTHQDNRHRALASWSGTGPRFQGANAPREAKCTDPAERDSPS